MKICVINGHGGSGKDTFEEFVMDYARDKERVIVGKLSIIDSVKDIAKEIGWAGGKTDKDRKFLFEFKKLLTEYNDYPRNALSQKIRDCKKIGITYLFIDAREIEDIEWLKLEYNATVILIDRGITHFYGNAADDGVMDIVYDLVVDNTGTLDDLRAGAEYFWENYFK